MGEAKRRKKLLGENYGKPPIKCFLKKAQISDCHAIYLHLPNDRTRIVSVHRNIEVAYEMMCKCNNVLKEVVVSAQREPDIIFREFIQELVGTYGHYESDDAEYISSINGVTAIKPPVIKKYIALPLDDSTDVGYVVAETAEVEEDDLGLENIAKNLLSNLSNGMPYYAPVPDKRKIVQLLKVDNGIFVLSSYETAAYIADFVNENELSLAQLNKTTLHILWTKANQMQGKL